MTQYKIDDFQIYEYSSDQPRAVIFFAHANGIPALTYAGLWAKVAQRLNVRVICYDMRGIGKTTALPIYDTKTWGWKTLVNDHVMLFERIKKTHPKNTRFILCGHSTGAWLSLLSTEFLGVYPLILCDPPMLRRRTAFLWYLLYIFNKKEKAPLSQKALKRKTSFDSFQDAYQSLKQTPFLSQWDDESLKNYIEGVFVEDPVTKRLTLRHLPEWESHIFAQYPPTVGRGLKQIPKKIRQELKPTFLVAELSDACNPKAKRLVKCFLPNLEWTIVPNVGHMFPIENQDIFLNEIKKIIG